MIKICNPKLCKTSNPDIAINMLFHTKKGIYTAPRTKINRKCSQQVNSHIMVDREIRLYTAIKYISKLLLQRSRKSNHSYCFCMLSLNGFWIVPVREIAMSTAAATAASRCFLKKEKNG